MAGGLCAPHYDRQAVTSWNGSGGIFGKTKHMEKRDSLLRRIRALAAKTVAAGCTESEALAASSLLARLVDKYGFTFADIDEPLEAFTESSLKANRAAR